MFGAAIDISCRVERNAEKLSDVLSRNVEGFFLLRELFRFDNVSIVSRDDRDGRKFSGKYDLPYKIERIVYRYFYVLSISIRRTRRRGVKTPSISIANYCR